jgi:hypothetical protein
MAKMFLFLLVPFALFALSLSKDTVYSVEVTTQDVFDTLFKNTALTLVKIDSMSIRTLVCSASRYEFSFSLKNNQAFLGQFGFLSLGGSVAPITTDSFSVPANATLIMHQIACDVPVSMGKAQKRENQLNFGDPIIVRLYFYSQTGNDSLTVISKQLEPDRTIRRLSSIKPSFQLPNAKNPEYNLRGQPVDENGKISGVFLETTPDKLVAKARR